MFLCASRIITIQGANGIRTSGCNSISLIALFFFQPGRNRSQAETQRRTMQVLTNADEEEEGWEDEATLNERRLLSRYGVWLLVRSVTYSISSVRKLIFTEKVNNYCKMAKFLETRCHFPFTNNFGKLVHGEERYCKKLRCNKFIF